MEFILFIVYIALSFVVLSVANGKGRSGCGWFFLSLLISPIIVLIILAVIGDTEEKRRETLQADIETTEEIKKKISEKVSATPTATSARDKAIEELKRSKELLDLNVITKEEYDAKKAELLPLLTSRSDVAAESKSTQESKQLTPTIYDVYSHKLM